MLFMLRISVQMMVLALLMPHLWVGALGLGVVTYLARRRARMFPEPQRRGGWTGSAASLLFLLVVPLAMLAWGWYFQPEGPPGRGAHGPLALRGLEALAVLELGACLFVVWRQRGRPRGVSAAALAMWWTAGAYATAGMAITNTWL